LEAEYVWMFFRDESRRYAGNDNDNDNDNDERTHV
jgi:hypothetical protein